MGHLFVYTGSSLRGHVGFIGGNRSSGQGRGTKLGPSEVYSIEACDPHMPGFIGTEASVPCLGSLWTSVLTFLSQLTVDLFEWIEDKGKQRSYKSTYQLKTLRWVFFFKIEV